MPGVSVPGRPITLAFMRSAFCVSLFVASKLLAANPQTGGPAASDLRARVRRQPESYEANHNFGEYLVHQHDLNRAIPYLRKAYALRPDNYENGYDLALVCLETGAMNESRRIVSDLLNRQDRAELHNLLGDVEEKDGRIEAAAQQYEIAARMDPSEKNLFDLGSDLLLHKGFQAALTVFEYATQRYPQSAKMQVGLGIAHYSLGQYQSAIESLCRGIDLDPKDTRAFDFLGKMYDVAPAQEDEVSKYLAHFASSYPDNAAANYYYALSLRRRTEGALTNGADEIAEKLLVRAVDLKPGFSDAHFQLGLLYEDNGQDSQAIREYRIVTRLDPAFAKARYRLSRLYEKNGQRELAQKELEAFEQLKTNR